MISYQGSNDGRVIVVDGKKKKPLDPARQVGIFPDAAFEWGSGTTQGAARLAAAIARHALGDDAAALKVYQRLKYRTVAEFPKGGPWMITKDRVLEIVAEILDVEKASASARAAVAREPAPRANDGGQGIVWNK